MSVYVLVSTKGEFDRFVSVWKSAEKATLEIQKLHPDIKTVILPEGHKRLYNDSVEFEIRCEFVIGSI